MVIHIEQDSQVPENECLRVAAPTGDYDDSALIPCYSVDDPSSITGSFQAQFIKYGGMVYRFNEAKDLGEEILKTDPQSTHMAASYVRMADELEKKMDAGSLVASSLTQVIAEEQASVQDQILNPDATDASSTPATADPSAASGTTTPPSIEIPTDIPTPPTDTTSIVTPDTQTSTTTQGVIPDTQTSTTTPAVSDTITTPTIDAASSTDQIIN